MDKKDFYTVLPGARYLVISSNELTLMREFRQCNRFSTEAGGLLIGSLHQEHNTPFSLKHPPHIEVTGVSIPGEGDIRKRSTFIRNGKHHIQLVKDARIASDGMVDYLGEWHTHPELNPTPSLTDILYWRQNLSGRHAVLIIVGMISEWFGYWDGQKAIALPSIKLDSRGAQSSLK